MFVVYAATIMLTHGVLEILISHCYTGSATRRTAFRFFLEVFVYTMYVDIHKALTFMILTQI